MFNREHSHAKGQSHVHRGEHNHTHGTNWTHQLLCFMALQGFRLAYPNDYELLERELFVYDALYAYCRQAISQNTPGDGPKN